jgi:hypothetical protein
MKWILSCLLGFLGSFSQMNATSSDGDTEKVITEAYVYGFPLVIMDITKNVLTDTPKLTSQKAPINQFLHMRKFPDPSFTEVVSPNADTLYSQAWIDVSKEPIILSIPEMGDRYYVFPLLDEWTNVYASLGTRTTGNRQGAFAITGSAWKGSLPEGVKELKSPTNLSWLIGRIQTNGPNDFAAVKQLQDQFKLIPLSAWEKEYTPPIDVPVAPGIDSTVVPIVQVLLMEGPAFFTKLAELLKKTPIPVADVDYVKKFAQFGLIPGQDFSVGSLTPLQTERLNEAVASAKIGIKKLWDEHPFARMENGWGIITKGIGSYGTNYDVRAAVAFGGLGANLPEDAVYPTTNVDSAGLPLNGNFRYTIHFDKGKLPPVNAFWSITLYNDQHFFVPNSIHRYAIGSRDAFKFNEDGSLDIYIQNELPKGFEENWLPAPKEPFNLIFRLYYPKQEVLDGSWKPPVVKKVAV